MVTPPLVTFGQVSGLLRHADLRLLLLHCTNPINTPLPSPQKPLLCDPPYTCPMLPLAPPYSKKHQAVFSSCGAPARLISQPFVTMQTSDCLVQEAGHVTPPVKISVYTV